MPLLSVLLLLSLSLPSNVSLLARTGRVPTHWMALAVDAELLEMIERADTDTDGEISPDEFYAIMTKKTFT